MKKQYLEKILESCQDLNLKRQSRKPIFVKISPDLNDDEILKIVDICKNFEISGVVSTNTTTNHSFSHGGLSGRPLGRRSDEISRLIKNNSDLVVVSSGGIIDKEIGKQRLQNYDLIQLYTGLVYQGPSLVKEILQTI